MHNAAAIAVSLLMKVGMVSIMDLTIQREAFILCEKNEIFPSSSKGNDQFQHPSCYKSNPKLFSFLSCRTVGLVANKYSPVVFQFFFITFKKQRIFTKQNKSQTCFVLFFFLKDQLEFKKKKKIYGTFLLFCLLVFGSCGVTICSPNPEVLGYKPNERNTINLQRVGERTGFLMDCLAVNQGFKSVRAGKDASLWMDYTFEEQV